MILEGFMIYGALHETFFSRYCTVSHHCVLCSASAAKRGPFMVRYRKKATMTP